MSLRLRRDLALAAVLFVSTGALAACGSDDDSGTEAPAQGPTPSQQESGQANGATGPASANDERPDAPDDAISDRPGGPNDKSGDEPVGTTQEVGKEKGGSVSGGISPDGAPVSPESP